MIVTTHNDAAIAARSPRSSKFDVTSGNKRYTPLPNKLWAIVGESRCGRAIGTEQWSPGASCGGIVSTCAHARARNGGALRPTFAQSFKHQTP